MKVIFKHCTPLHVVSDAIRECYDSHHLSDTVESPSFTGSVCTVGAKDKELIYKVGNINKHASTLEHLVFNIRIEGVSRMLLQEFARHRIASLSVKSTRFTLQELKREAPFTSRNDGEQRAKEYLVFPCRSHFEDESEHKAFIGMMVLQLEFLREAISDGVKRDVAKYLVPDSYKTNITWTINARSLQNFLALRTSQYAHFEIRELANQVFQNMPHEYKYLFTDFVAHTNVDN